MQPKADALEWLDYTVTITLNPAKTDISTITEWQTGLIIRKANEERNNQKFFLRHYTIGLYSPRKIGLLVSQYQRWLVLLLDHAHENVLQIGVRYLHVYQACQYIIATMENIYKLISSLFPEYLAIEVKVPAVDLDEIKKEIKQRVDVIKVSLSAQTPDKLLTDMLFHAFHSFTSESDKRVISVREVRYKKELIAGLEKIIASGNQTRIHEDLLELLIYLNFNSRAFMNYYTISIAKEINVLSSPNEKMDLLLFHHKKFNQMHRKPGSKLNPFYEDVKEVVGNWFAQEISYMEKKHQRQVTPLSVETPSLPYSKPEHFKVMCFLSVDQIALLLRSMDALRIFQAKSLNVVMKSIAPYLSTPRKEDISWESLRSKSYVVEESDRLVAIKTLESMIQWIKDY